MAPPPLSTTFPTLTKLFIYKLINPTFLITLLILCTLSYFLGSTSFHHPTTTKLSTTPSCTTPTNSSSIIPTPLDFSSHHALSLPPAARAPHFPPCSPKLSEHTPCHDPKLAVRFPRHRLAYRDRHCPDGVHKLRCRVPAPEGYRTPVRWPESRDKVWFANVPHKWLTVEKAGQNWVRFEGDRFTFPGGGTMFPRGADVYVDQIGKLVNLKDGSVRTAVDTGCGVASWGAYLLSRNILTMSFAPKDSHEAQIQFALERGVPAMIGIMASNRVPYPSRSFDIAHCSRCLIPWAQYDGLFLLEVDRILRPGGYWVLSGPPINWEAHWKGWNRTKDDLRSEQLSIEEVAKSLCWKKIKQKGDIAVWQKPYNHIHCRASHNVIKKPPFCNQTQDPDQAW